MTDVFVYNEKFLEIVYIFSYNYTYIWADVFSDEYKKHKRTYKVQWSVSVKNTITNTKQTVGFAILSRSVWLVGLFFLYDHCITTETNSKNNLYSVQNTVLSNPYC